MAVLHHVETVKGQLTSSAAFTDVTLKRTITDTAKTFVFLSGHVDSNNPFDQNFNGQLLNSTTVRVARRGTNSPVTDFVVHVCEFYSGVSVQRGTVDLNSAVSGDVTLSDLDLTKSFRLSSHTTEGGTWAGDDCTLTYLWDDAGTKKLHWHHENVTQGDLTWQAVEYDGCVVQRGNETGMTAGTASTTEALSPAVDLAKTWLNFSHRAPGGAGDVSKLLIRGRFTSTTVITFDRVNSASEAITEIRWEAIEFTDDTVVQEQLLQHTTSDAVIKNATITAVRDINRAAPYASYIGRGGKTDYTADDKASLAFWGLELTTLTNLEYSNDSGTNSATSDVAVYILDWGPDPYAPDSAAVIAMGPVTVLHAGG